VTLKELAHSSKYLFMDFDAPDPKAAKKHLRPIVKAPLQEVSQALAELADWRPQYIQQSIQAIADRHDLGFGKLGQPLRVAVTGGAVSPPIDLTLELVGRERSLSRIGAALTYIGERERSAAP
jgi:glutamyl-tRNA synthetase